MLHHTLCYYSMLNLVNKFDYVAMHCVVLYYIVLYFIRCMLYHIMLHYRIMLDYIVICSIVYHIILYYVFKSVLQLHVVLYDRLYCITLFF